LINRLVIENLKYRPIRTLLSIVAISVQVTLVLALVGLSDGMLNDQARRARGVGADILVRPPNGALILTGGQMLEHIIPALIEKTPHVTVASGVLAYGTDLFNYITGIDLKSFDAMSGGFHFVQGGPFQHPDDVMVDEYYAAQHKVRAGDTITIINRPWRISGVYRPGMLARLVVPLATLQDLTANTGKVTMVYVKVDQPSNIVPTIDDLAGRLKQFKIYSMEDYMSLFSPASIPLLTQFIGVVIGLGVLVGFLVVFLSMYTAVLERTREIGVLKALGASPGLIMNILLRETVVLALAGSVLGIVFAFGTRSLIGALMPGTLVQAIVYAWWWKTTAIALLGALLGAIYPGLKAARQDAIEALAYE
jgi:putative ABC transport system permease protein